MLQGLEAPLVLVHSWNWDPAPLTFMPKKRVQTAPCGILTVGTQMPTYSSLSSRTFHAAYIYSKDSSRQRTPQLPGAPGYCKFCADTITHDLFRFSVGVGWSYADYGTHVQDTPEAARDVNAFVNMFFDVFDEFKGRAFHLAGESYGVSRAGSAGVGTTDTGLGSLIDLVRRDDIYRCLLLKSTTGGGRLFKKVDLRSIYSQS